MMAANRPMDPHLIFDTPYWTVTHRRDSRYPGYLIISTRGEQRDLHELATTELQELGPVLREVEILLRRAYSPFKVIYGKAGFSPGFACHFHAIPVTDTLLAEIAAHPDYADEPDGSDAMLYVNRIHCERPLDPHETEAMTDTISALRALAAPTPFPAQPPSP